MPGSSGLPIIKDLKYFLLTDISSIKALFAELYETSLSWKSDLYEASYFNGWTKQTEELGVDYFESFFFTSENSFELQIIFINQYSYLCSLLHVERAYELRLGTTRNLSVLFSFYGVKKHVLTTLLDLLP